MITAKLLVDTAESGSWKQSRETESMYSGWSHMSWNDYQSAKKSTFMKWRRQKETTSSRYYWSHQPIPTTTQWRIGCTHPVRKVHNFLYLISEIFWSIRKTCWCSIAKLVPPQCQSLMLKCIKFDFRWGSAPDPAVRAYSTAPDP